MRVNISLKLLHFNCLFKISSLLWMNWTKHELDWINRVAELKGGGRRPWGEWEEVLHNRKWCFFLFCFFICSMFLIKTLQLAHISQGRTSTLLHTCMLSVASLEMFPFCVMLITLFKQELDSKMTCMKRCEQLTWKCRILFKFLCALRSGISSKELCHWLFLAVGIRLNFSSWQALSAVLLLFSFRLTFDVFWLLTCVS